MPQTVKIPLGSSAALRTSPEISPPLIVRTLKQSLSLIVDNYAVDLKVTVDKNDFSSRKKKRLIAVNDSVIAAYRETHDGDLRDKARSAMFDKAVWCTLHRQLGSNSKIATELFSEFINLFGSDTSENVQSQVNDSLLIGSFLLGEIGSLEEAIVTCDSLLKRLDGDDRPDALYRLSIALFRKASWLRSLERTQEAIEVCDETIKRFNGAFSEIGADAIIREAVWLNQIGLTQQSLQMTKEAVFIHDLITSHPENFSDAGYIESYTARAIFNNIVCYDDLDDKQNGLQQCDEFLSKFWFSDSDMLFELTVSVCWHKHDLLCALERPDTLLKHCEEFVSRFENSSNLEIHQMITSFIFSIGSCNLALGHPEAALASSDLLISKYSNYHHDGIKSQVAQAYIAKALLLREMNRYEDSIAEFDRMWFLFSKESEKFIAERIIQSFFDKSFVLLEAGREADVLIEYVKLRTFCARQNFAVGEKISDFEGMFSDQLPFFLTRQGNYSIHAGEMSSSPRNDLERQLDYLKDRYVAQYGLDAAKTAFATRAFPSANADHLRSGSPSAKPKTGDSRAVSHAFDAPAPKSAAEVPADLQLTVAELIAERFPHLPQTERSKAETVVLAAFGASQANDGAKLDALFQAARTEVEQPLPPPRRLNDADAETFKAFLKQNPWIKASGKSPSEFIRNDCAWWLKRNLALTDVRSAQQDLANNYSAEISDHPERRLLDLYVKSHKLPPNELRPKSLRRTAELTKEELNQRRKSERDKKARLRAKKKTLHP